MIKNTFYSALSLLILAGISHNAMANDTTMQVSVADYNIEEEFDGAFLEDEAVIIDSENKTSDYISDKHEVTNRSIHRLNESIDKAILTPVARGYRYVTPSWGRDRVHNFVNNLQTPISFFNSIIQGNSSDAFANFWRFIVNSTFGIGGMIDISTQAGLEPAPQDFGKTLASWDINDGEYIVLPLLGPSTYRDATGKIVDSILNPFSYISWPAKLGLTSTSVISGRERILDITDDIYENSFDPYSAIKSTYLQYRAKR